MNQHCVYIHVFSYGFNLRVDIMVGFRFKTNRFSYHSTVSSFWFFTKRKYVGTLTQWVKKCHFSLLCDFLRSTFHSLTLTFQLNIPLLTYFIRVRVICLFGFTYILAFLLPSFHLHVSFVFHFKC